MPTHTFLVRAAIPRVSSDALFAWHERAGAFERLAPPWEPVALVSRAGTIRDGDETVLRLKMGPLGVRWRARHEGYLPGRRFIDRQVAGPFRSWVHTHTTSPDEGGGATLEDRIDYELPLGALGDRVLGRGIERRLTRMFNYRHATLANDLERHRQAALPRQIIAVTGASGLIGRALCAFLESGGHEVRRVVRHAPGPGEVQWDPDAGTIDAAALTGVTAAVHLAGENISGGRWTAARKRKIEDSRVRGTNLFASTLAGLPVRPAVLVSASAVGYYGTEPAPPHDEHSPPGDDFLAHVCKAWEDAAQPARDAGIRVVHPRFGVVLSPAGGALGKMLTPFSMGAGGKIGKGTQPMSWVAIDDAVYAIHHALATPAIGGPVNVVAPGVVTNAEFTKTLGHVLGRPTIVPLPGPIVKLLFGELGDTLLLHGQEVRPRALLESGFRFAHASLEDALRHVLGRSTVPSRPEEARAISSGT